MHDVPQAQQQLQVRREKGEAGTAAQPVAPANEGLSLVNSALGFWNAARGRLKELESMLSNQVLPQERTAFKLCLPCQ